MLFFVVKVKQNIFEKKVKKEEDIFSTLICFNSKVFVSLNVILFKI